MKIKKNKSNDKMSQATPKYVHVHSSMTELGQATNGQLSKALGYTKLQVTGALVQLQQIGAVERVSRGTWRALALPPGFPQRRGRPASEASVRGMVLKALSKGAAPLSEIVDSIPDAATDRNKVRARVAHALVSLKNDGVVGVAGERGTYVYELVGDVSSAA